MPKRVPLVVAVIAFVLSGGHVPRVELAGASMKPATAPTAIALSTNVLPDGLPAGTTVGTLSTTDADAGDTFTYTLVSGTGSMDNASFQILGNVLQTSAVLDYKARNPYSIRVRSTDSGGLSTEKAFTVVPPSYMLWSRSDTGQAALWQLDPATGALIGSVWLNSSSGVGGPWLATGFQYVNGTTGYVLWTRSDTGQAALWKVDPGTGLVKKSAFLYSKSGVGGPWQATSYAHVSDTEGYVLWTRSDSGRAAIWRINPGGIETLTVLPIDNSAFVYSNSAGVGSPWKASSYEHVSNTEGYVLWTRSDTGQAALWQVNPSAMPAALPITSSVVLRPTSGVGSPWQAMSYEHVGGGEGHVLWTNSSSGQAVMWKVDPGTGVLNASEFMYPKTGVGTGWQATDYAHNAPPATYSLSVGTANPASGVSIAASPADVGALAGGVSPFQRTYANGVSVTLSAPSAADGNPFVSWSGCDNSDATTCTVTMNGRRSVTASYATPPATYSLNVATANPASGVSIAVTPADRGALADGASPFQRTYANGVSVTLTAPGDADGNSFLSWSGCDSSDTTTCTVTMNGSRSVTASYGAADCESCHNGVQTSYPLAPNVMGDGTNPVGVGATPKPFDDGTWGFNVNGHGANGTATNTPADYAARVMNAKCTDCHELQSHHLNGTLEGVNGVGRISRVNTYHLRTDGTSPFVPASVTNDWDVQVAFDDACYRRCHVGKSVKNMRHAKDLILAPAAGHETNYNNIPNAVHFGDKGTVADGENLVYYLTGAPALYPVDSDISTRASTAPEDFAPCISCHNPHGTNVVETNKTTNRMVRDSFYDQNTLCLVCHS